MNFKNIGSNFHPAYTWLWNTTITREGIKERIDEMYNSGIRAFYVLGEPKNFRPNKRRTHLSPEYLSDEYLDLVYYAYELAEEKDMYTWLYNEGGFPSGMACGQVRKKHPELAMKSILKREFILGASEEYTESPDALSAFAAGKRIMPGERFDFSTSVTEYYAADNPLTDIQTDNASLENCKRFIDSTHEKFKHRFGSVLGSKITLMFDDEAFMGTWTVGLDNLFYKKYGYEIYDYLPFITGDAEPKSDVQYKAKSDYIMLCGDLVRENYFIPMKKWLNENGMLSTGHIDNDHRADGIVINRYGNSMKALRAFDVPGVDVIWNQLYYPNLDNTFEGMIFFPRFASSAARQLGHSAAVSESLAVYGAHVDQELMRFVVNVQAVRGISLFNFMVMSYDRKTPMLHQYRPNFVKENPSMDRLSEINEYTARLSYILQNSRADIDSALYFPARTIAAGGEIGKKAIESFTRLGEELEAKGVSFDIIDEEIVISAEKISNTLVYNGIRYENIFIPYCELEKEEVKKAFFSLKAEVLPCIERENKSILSRKMIFETGDEGYFIVNSASEPVTEKIRIKTDKTPYIINLYDGEIYKTDYSGADGFINIDLNLLRGDGLFILLSDRAIEAITPEKEEYILTLTDFSSFVSRRLRIDTELGTVNEYFDSGEIERGLYAWDRDFSGEVTYTSDLAALEKGEYILDLGKVSSTALVYLGEELIGEKTMPPYKLKFTSDGTAKKLKIIIANTAANECARTDYFDKNDKRDVGPYHEKMKILEAKKECGGLFGPVTIAVRGEGL
ncbi:MAG: hypothetical protein E7612_07610 [Ruminococcaceae bacterium]|nr:hypothetical protein [Oscillospiraceae bacterium]